MEEGNCRDAHLHGLVTWDDHDCVVTGSIYASTQVEVPSCCPQRSVLNRLASSLDPSVLCPANCRDSFVNVRIPHVCMGGHAGKHNVWLLL